MKEIFPRKSGSWGFTLLELLVVISIIGILIALGVASYTTAQKNSRDAKRRTDMKTVQSAMEQYFSVNGAYPAASNCNAADISTVLPAGLPADPKPGHTAYHIACSTGAYCICATLEQQNVGNATGYANTSCTFGASGAYYCVQNLQ